MKKIIVLLMLTLFAVSIFPQEAAVTGMWLVTRAEAEGQVFEPYYIIDFKENGSMEFMGMGIGTWQYDKAGSRIIMKSEFDKDFNGENKILKLNGQELVVRKDETTIFYSKINQNEINENNKKSELPGLWKSKDTEYSDKFFKFELPDSFQTVEISVGMTESAIGTWIYNTLEKSVIIIGFTQDFKGKNIIKKLTKNELILENNGNRISLTRFVSDEGNIERLTFEYDDFPEEYTGEYSLPWMWSEFREMVHFLSGVKSVKYRKGKIIEDLNILKYTTLISEIETDIDEQSVEFTNFIVEYGDSVQHSQNYKGRLSEMYNNFFPKDEPYPYRITGIETVTVPAGTFECTVVEGFIDEQRVKYWMINDKPGIYAKTVLDGESMFGDPEYNVAELEDISAE